MKKSFDAVAWMRTRRVKIDEEDQALSWEKKGQKTRKLLEDDPLWIKLKTRMIRATGPITLAVGEEKGEYGTKRQE